MTPKQAVKPYKLALQRAKRWQAKYDKIKSETSSLYSSSKKEFLDKRDEALERAMKLFLIIAEDNEQLLLIL